MIERAGHFIFLISVIDCKQETRLETCPRCSKECEGRLMVREEEVEEGEAGVWPHLDMIFIIPADLPRERGSSLGVRQVMEDGDCN